MKPIPLTETQMAELFRIRAENEALRARLAEIESQEPVAWRHRDGMLSCRLPGGGVPGIDWTPLFAAPVVCPDVEKMKAEIVSLRQQIRASQSNVMARDEYIQSLTTELVAVLKDAEWQPIEAAPKTGAHLAWEDGKCPYVIVWLDANHPDADAAGWHEHWDLDLVAPTHWKPLPKPPAIEQAKGGVK